MDDQTFARECRNSIDQKVACEATIEKYEPCGINATSFPRDRTVWNNANPE